MQDNWLKLNSQNKDVRSHSRLSQHQHHGSGTRCPCSSVMYPTYNCCLQCQWAWNTRMWYFRSLYSDIFIPPSPALNSNSTPRWAGVTSGQTHRDLFMNFSTLAALVIVQSKRFCNIFWVGWETWSSTKILEVAARRSKELDDVSIR